MELAPERITELATEFNCSEEIVKDAAALGYDPDRYEKDNPKFRTPEQFLEFGEQLNPILRENNRRLLEKNALLEKKIKDIQLEVAKFAKLHEQTREEAYQKAMEELKARKITALDNQDHAAVVEIDEEIANTKAAMNDDKTAKPEVNTIDIPADIHETYTAFMKAHPWADPASDAYNEDMEAYAVAVGEQRIRKGLPHAGDDFKDHLEEIAKKVEKHFSPDKTERPIPTVESGYTGSAKSGSKKTYAQLPQEYKDACDFLISTGTFKNREQYLAKVEWDKIRK